MRVTYQIEKSGPRDFIVGYGCTAVGGHLLPDVLATLDGGWRDEHGNPLWELLEDGKVVPANLTPTTEQTSKHEKKQREAKVTGSFDDIVAEAIRTTSNANQSWAAIDAALRALLT